MKNFIDKVMYQLSQPQLNLVKTLYFNFRLLPFHIAIKLPIYIYGPVKFYWLKGKIEIHYPNIYSGMIKLGRNNEFFNGVDKSAFINIGIGGKLIFEGPCAISNNYKIRIAENATLTLGCYTFFGSAIKFICTNSIYIGQYTRCAYESQIVDSNFHFVYNEKTRTTTRRNGPIYIGAFNWIGNRTTINKGAKTQDYTIVCAGSLLNKDFSLTPENNQMLGGMPAKLITSGLKRIFSTKIEDEVISYFNKNNEKNNYTFNEDFEDNLDSIKYWFKNIM